MNINSTVISGAGAANEMQYVFQNVKRALIVTDANVVRLAPVQKLIEQVQSNVSECVIIDSVPPEPSHQNVADILAQTSIHGIDIVVGIGGGSVLDVAKLLSVLCKNDADVTLESLLAGHKPTNKVKSLLIPTTAGTGSEATPNAILAIPEKETKVGIISPVMLPDYVALLPELTVTMPPHILASTGIDALCHLIECFTSNVANPVSDNYALIGMKKLFASLETAFEEPNNLEAKLNMLWASYYGGAAIAHAGTHLVHAMSYPLGGKYHIPHGVANAILLAPCMRFIRECVVDKFAQVYDLLPYADVSLSNEDKSIALVHYFDELVSKLKLPTKLSELKIYPDEIPSLTKAAFDVQRLIKNVPMQIDANGINQVYSNIA